LVVGLGSRLARAACHKPPAGGRDVKAVVDALDRSSLRVLANP
jgi:hypothetical protein